MNVLCAILAFSAPLAVYTSEAPSAPVAVSTATLETANTAPSRPMWEVTRKCSSAGLDYVQRYFERPFYRGNLDCSCEVPEDVAVGTRLFKVPHAFWTPIPERLSFRKEDQAGIAWRHFDIVDGMIVVNASLDREQWTVYTLEAMVHYSGEPDMPLKLRVHVMDVNDHPPHFPNCPDLPVVVAADAPIGMKLLNFSISDHDVNSTEFLASLSGPFADYFAVTALNQSSGREQELEVAKPLVDSAEDGLKVTLTAHDQGNLSASCEIRIVTADVRPRFKTCPMTQLILGNYIFAGARVSAFEVEAFHSFPRVDIDGDDADSFKVFQRQSELKCKPEWTCIRYIVATARTVNAAFQENFNIVLNVSADLGGAGENQCRIQFTLTPSGHADSDPVVHPHVSPTWTEFAALLLLIVAVASVLAFGIGYAYGMRTRRLPSSRTDARQSEQGASDHNISMTTLLTASTSALDTESRSFLMS